MKAWSSGSVSAAVALLMVVLAAGCSDISSSQLATMDQDVKRVLDPSLDGSSFVSKHPTFKKFSDVFRENFGTFKTSSVTVTVDRKSEPPVATRNYIGDYDLTKGTSTSQGTAEIKATFKLEADKWILDGLAVVSPEIEFMDAKTMERKKLNLSTSP